MSTKPTKGDLRVWWIPQVPMKAFYVPVASLAEAKKLLGVLADYDIFQFENKVKPDYSNAGGLQCFSQDGDGDWCDWYDEETGDDIDDIDAARIQRLDGIQAAEKAKEES